MRTCALFTTYLNDWQLQIDQYYAMVVRFIFMVISNGIYKRLSEKIENGKQFRRDRYVTYNLFSEKNFLSTRKVPLYF